MSLYDAADAYWRSAKLECVERKMDKLAEYVKLLETKYTNGKVVARVFSIQVDTDSREFIIVDLLRSLLASRLLVNHTVKQSFGGYRLIEGFGEKHDFTEMTPYELPGYLGSLIQNGGAYSSNTPDMKYFYLGLSAALEMADNDLNNLYIVSSNLAWSSYFKDVAWDHTVIAYNKLRNEFIVIMATDED
jgi:hypothetical protein